MAVEWIDTHCHWDAAEFGSPTQAASLRSAAKHAGVSLCIVPAVHRQNFVAVRDWAHTHNDAYALGIHPLHALDAGDDDVAALDAQLAACRDDPRLVAVGEIGLDGFVPALQTPEAKAHCAHIYRSQLKLARKHQLPVILHVRKSADDLLKHLRQLPVCGGIAHAFNGSAVQAAAFTSAGFCLGFGGTLTFEASRQIRRLAQDTSLTHVVLETDGPDIPPHWLYVTAHARAQGQRQAPNSSRELPRIAEVMAGLKGVSLGALAAQTQLNACRVLPRLAKLVLKP